MSENSQEIINQNDDILKISKHPQVTKLRQNNQLTFNQRQRLIKIYQYNLSDLEPFNKYIYLYNEITKHYKNPTDSQILMSAAIFNSSPWYNKWSVFNYYSQNDLDTIYEIYNYFSPINNPDDEKSFFKYFYDNRKILGNNISKYKYKLISNFIKSGWQPKSLLEKFSPQEQGLIIQWLENSDLAEIATTEMAIKNLLVLHKTLDINPVDYIEDLKSHQTNLSNLDIYAILNTDIIELFSNEPFKRDVPFDINHLSDIQKDFFVSGLISNAFNCLKSELCNYNAPQNFISENETFKNMLFVSETYYFFPYCNEIPIKLQTELITEATKHFEKIFQFVQEKGSGMDTIAPTTLNYFGFIYVYDNNKKCYMYDEAKSSINLTSIKNGDKVEYEIAVLLPTIFEQLYHKKNLFLQNPILTSVNLLQNPENIIQLDSNSSISLKFLEIFIKDNNALLKLPKILSYVNLSTPWAQSILNNETIKEHFPTLEIEIINEKRKSIPSDYNFSNEFLFYLPKIPFDKNKFDKLQKLNDNIPNIKNCVKETNEHYILNATINNAISNTDLINIISNIAKAQKYKDISTATINYIRDNINYNDSVINFLAINKNQDLLQSIILNTNSKPLIESAAKFIDSNTPTKFTRFVLSKIDNFTQYYSIYKTQETKLEKEIRDILNEINKICKTNSNEQNYTGSNEEIAQQATEFIIQNSINTISIIKPKLYSFANCLRLNAINEKDKGITDDENVSLYIFNQVSERLPEGLAKEIFLEVATNEYENSFRAKLNSAKLISSSQSLLENQSTEEQQL